MEWNDERVDPSTHSQFQPPSASRCSTNQAASPSTSAPSQTPFASVQALMQQSTSPPQYGRSSYSQRLFAASRCGGVRQHGRVDSPLAQRVQRPCRRRPRLARALRRLRPVEVEAGGEERAAGPLTVRILQGEQPRAEPLGRDASARRRPDLLRRAEQVPLDLPAQRGVGVEQPAGQGAIHHAVRVRGWSSHATPRHPGGRSPPGGGRPIRSCGQMRQ